MGVDPDRLSQFICAASGWVNIPSGAEDRARDVVNAAFDLVEAAFGEKRRAVPADLAKLLCHTRDSMRRKIVVELKKCRPRVVGKKRIRRGVPQYVAEERLITVVTDQIEKMNKRLRKFKLSPEDTFIALDIEFIGDRVESGIIKIIGEL